MQSRSSAVVLDPPATRKDSVVDDYHGTTITDPYRWLEDGDDPQVRAWTDQQNERTDAYLHGLPGYDALYARLLQVLQIGSLSAPTVRTTPTGEKRYFFTRRQGEQDQRILYVRDGEAGQVRPLIEVSSLSADRTTALAWMSPSPDGTLVAWGKSEGGSEESSLHVRDVASAVDLPDVIEHTRRVSIAWLPDSSGFFYTRYPAPGTVPKGDERYHRKVYLHELGADPETDELMFPCPGEERAKTDSPSVTLSPKGRWLVVQVHQGAQKSEIHVRDRSLGTAGPWIGVATGIEAVFSATPRDDVLYLLTNYGAPQSRVFAVDYEHPDRSRWRELIPEGVDVLRSVTIIGDVLVARYMCEAASRLERFSLDGRSLGPLTLPQAGSVTVHGPSDGNHAFVRFTSFANPCEILRFDLDTGAVDTWDKLGAGFALPDAQVTRLYATSQDGTRVPMFVVANKHARHEGPAPTILTGYGGFNLCVSLEFSARAIAAVERGAVWVLAVLRGGGEFGKAWHRAGMLANKQNVFDDFIACAEALIRAGITSPQRLGILGSSNGGLLTAAVVTQRPELFRAALCDVPLTDMLRYQHFRIGRLWIPEYGCSENPEQFDPLYAYSPYHRVVDGTTYPAMLFVTAENDSRVDPMHARKMAARMQEAQPRVAAATRPILLRVESRAGHGAGKPVFKEADEFTAEMAFLGAALGIPASETG